MTSLGNPFRVATNVLPVSQGSALARNPGLEFANAFGVYGTLSAAESSSILMVFQGRAKLTGRYAATTYPIG